MVNYSRALDMAKAQSGVRHDNQVAQKSGVSVEAIIAIRRGVTNPNTATIQKLAAAFDMKVSEFVALGEE